MIYKKETVRQSIGYLLSLHDNHRMNKLKLMKELYIADREFIRDFGFSISGDSYFSLRHGPVLSFTLNILGDCENNVDGEWKDMISFQPALHDAEKHFKDIVLIKKDMIFDYLSEVEKDYLKNVADKYRKYTAWQLVDETHKFPEWKNPDATSDKIKLIDIFKALEKKDKEIEAFLINQREIESFDNVAISQKS